MWRLLVFFVAIAVAELNYSIVEQPPYFAEYFDRDVLYPWGNDNRPNCIERCGCGFCIRREGDPDWRTMPPSTKEITFVGLKFVHPPRNVSNVISTPSGDVVIKST